MKAELLLDVLLHSVHLTATHNAPNYTHATKRGGVLSVYLQRNIPGHVDVALVLVHPDLSHPQSVTPHVGRQVLRVGFVGALNVGNPGAGQHLHAAAALPHLCCTFTKRANS